MSEILVEDIVAGDKVRISHKTNGDSFTFTVKSISTYAILAEGFGFRRAEIPLDQYKVELLHRPYREVKVGEKVTADTLYRSVGVGSVVRVEGSNLLRLVGVTGLVGNYDTLKWADVRNKRELWEVVVKPNDV